MKHRRTREIVIELTSLLDVVMILIFAVLLQNAELLERKDKELDRVESEYAGIKGELDQLQGEKDKLLDEKDKLVGQLQEALDKLDKDNLNELWGKLDELKYIAEALEMLKDDAEMYYINTETFKNGPGDKDYDRMDIHFGPAGAEPDTISIKNNDKQSTVDSQLYNIERAIRKYIEENNICANSSKAFYLVLVFGEDYFTSVYDGFSEEGGIIGKLREHYSNYENINIVFKY